MNGSEPAVAQVIIPGSVAVSNHQPNEKEREKPGTMEVHMFWKMVLNCTNTMLIATDGYYVGTIPDPAETIPTRLCLSSATTHT